MEGIGNACISLIDLRRVVVSSGIVYVSLRIGRGGAVWEVVRSHHSRLIEVLVCCWVSSERTQELWREVWENEKSTGGGRRKNEDRIRKISCRTAQERNLTVLYAWNVTHTVPPLWHRQGLLGIFPMVVNAIWIKRVSMPDARRWNTPESYLVVARRFSDYMV